MSGSADDRLDADLDAVVESRPYIIGNSFVRLPYDHLIGVNQLSVYVRQQQAASGDPFGSCGLVGQTSIVVLRFLACSTPLSN